jgi:two-component system LytT family sensor kinase
MKKKWYEIKWITALIHAGAWILLFSLPYLLRPSYSQKDSPHTGPASPIILFIVSCIGDALLILFFYLNELILVPKFLYEKRRILYPSSVLFSFLCFTAIMYFIRFNYANDDHNFSLSLHILFSVFVFIFILACSLAYRLVLDKMTGDRIAKEKENEYLKTELALLRSQVSPHFMFNVLNNMVSLARKHSDQLEPSLIKLSSLMRYMLYETGEEKVSLENEKEYLSSYIDLQKQRFGKKVALNVNMFPADKMYNIEPMLLIPFVENAFKHGTGLIEDAQINITLKAQKNDLCFHVSNKFDDTSHEVKDKASGIGLANVQRRLQLLYPGKHKLNITKENDYFSAMLTINLS